MFCKLIAGDIPSSKVYEDADILAFRDINPQAPTHILITPKAHVEDIEACLSAQSGLTEKLFGAAARIAREQKLTNGYRLITNTGADARQTVRHFHIHLLGGAELTNTMG